MRDSVLNRIINASGKITRRCPAKLLGERIQLLRDLCNTWLKKHT